MSVATKSSLTVRLYVYDVLSLPEYHHAIIWILPRNPKVWAEDFTLAKDPNSKSPNGLQVQMVDSYDCGVRKGGAVLSPTMAVILSVCKLCTLICLCNPPCCNGGWEVVLDRSGSAVARPDNAIR